MHPRDKRTRTQGLPRPEPEPGLEGRPRELVAAVFRHTDPTGIDIADLAWYSAWGRAMAMLEDEQAILAKEGPVLPNGKVNPHLLAAERLSRQVCALGARLRLAPLGRIDRATAGRNARPQLHDIRPWEQDDDSERPDVAQFFSGPPRKPWEQV